MSMTRTHPLSIREHSLRVKRTKEFGIKLVNENKSLKTLLKKCGEMFITLGYKKRTAYLRAEIEQALTVQ